MSGRAIELINAEIDGVITGPERAELNRLLLADPAIRAQRDQHLRAARALGALDIHDVPDAVRESIMSALRLESANSRIRRGFPDRPVYRYAAAVAGVLIVSTLAFRMSSFDGSELSGEPLAGTMAPQPDADAQARIDLAFVKGSVAVAGGADAATVVARLSATQPIEVIARQGSREVRMSGFVPGSQRESVEQSAALGTGGPGAPVEIRIVDVATGAVLREMTLHAGASDR